MVVYEEIPLTTAQHNLAIAGIVLFAIPLLARIFHVAKGDRPKGRQAVRQYLLDLVLLFCLSERPSRTIEHKRLVADWYQCASWAMPCI